MIPFTKECTFSKRRHLYQTLQWYSHSHQIKYSNGGCSGLEPDSLLHLLSKQLFKPYLPYQYSVLNIVPLLRHVCKGAAFPTANPRFQPGGVRPAVTERQKEGARRPSCLNQHKSSTYYIQTSVLIYMYLPDFRYRSALPHRYYPKYTHPKPCREPASQRRDRPDA